MAEQLADALAGVAGAENVDHLHKLMVDMLQSSDVLQVLCRQPDLLQQLLKHGMVQLMCAAVTNCTSILMREAGVSHLLAQSSAIDLLAVLLGTVESMVSSIKMAGHDALKPLLFTGKQILGPCSAALAQRLVCSNTSMPILMAARAKADLVV